MWSIWQIYEAIYFLGDELDYKLQDGKTITGKSHDFYEDKGILLASLNEKKILKVTVTPHGKKCKLWIYLKIFKTHGFITLQLR